MRIRSKDRCWEDRERQRMEWKTGAMSSGAFNPVGLPCPPRLFPQLYPVHLPLTSMAARGSNPGSSPRITRISSLCLLSHDLKRVEKGRKIHKHRTYYPSHANTLNRRKFDLSCMPFKQLFILIDNM